MLNRLELIGHLGDDPKKIIFDNGVAITKANIAVTEKWKNSAGEPQEKTDWFSLLFPSKATDTVTRYLHKGSKIFIDGKMSSRTYEKEGQTHYAWEVIVHRFIFLDPPATAKQENI